MAGYIFKRVLFAIPTLLGVTIGIFLMVRLLPGDIIDILFGGDLSASEEVKDRAREQLGLTGSYPEQYWRWISGVLQGDFGDSLRNTEPVSTVILDALPITLDQAKRLPMYKEAQVLLQSELPQIGIIQVNKYQVVNKKVQGMYVAFDDFNTGLRNNVWLSA
jgi:ABC-type microcin C transport system permease subunit YejB